MSSRYVRLPVFEREVGYTVKAVEKKVETGAWTEGREYHRAPDGHILVDMEGFSKWVNPKHSPPG